MSAVYLAVRPSQGQDGWGVQRERENGQKETMDLNADAEVGIPVLVDPQCRVSADLLLHADAPGVPSQSAGW